MKRHFAVITGVAAVLTTITAGCTTYTPQAQPDQSTQPKVVVPRDVVFAELGQEREDVPLNLYQVQIHNDTDAEIDVARTSMTWSGFQTSAPNTKGTKIAPRAVVDQPVPFSGASCVGDGTSASMPSIDSATAVITFANGTKSTVPVVDANGILSKLYLSDCERQNIDKAVTITLTGFRDVTNDGLPRAEATIHLRRGASTGTIRLLDTKGTVIFTLSPLSPTNSPFLTMSSGRTGADLPVLVTEARCEDHAFAETKQPFLFVVSIDTGDGVEHGYNLVPDVSVQPHLFNMAIAACKIKNATATSAP